MTDRQRRWAALLITTFLMACGGFAAAQTPPGYEDAVAARDDGDFSNAERLAGEAVEADPTHVPSLFVLGQVQAFQSKFSQSLETLTEAQRLQPDNSDVTLMRARVLNWMGRPREANRAIEAALTRDPSNTEARDLKAQIAKQESEQYKWRLDFGGTYSSLERSALSDWSSQFLRLERDVSDRSSVFAYGEHWRRFGFDDFFLSLGGQTEMSEWLSVSAEAGATINPDFYHDWLLRGGVRARIASDEDWDSRILSTTLLTGSTTIRHFDVGTVHGFDFGIEQYLFNGRAWVTARMLNSLDADGKHLVGYAVDGTWSIIPRLRIRVGTALAPESDRGIVTDTRSYFGGVAFDLTDRTSLRIDFTNDDRKGSYIRRELAVAITTRF